MIAATKTYLYRGQYIEFFESEGTREFDLFGRVLCTADEIDLLCVLGLCMGHEPQFSSK